MKTKKCAPLKSVKMPKTDGDADITGTKKSGLKSYGKK